jgi:hypothetical protein
MEKNQSIDEFGKLKFPVGCCEYYEGNKSRYDFQKPGEIVTGFMPETISAIKNMAKYDFFVLSIDFG